MVVPDVFLQSGVSSLLNSINSVIQSLGVSVLLPIIIFLIAPVFRVDALKAVCSSILIGIGLIGINLIIGLFSESISPLAQQMVEVTGVTLPAVDVSWPATAAIAFGIAELGVWMIPLLVVMNLILFAIGFTYMLNVDIWNYWHFTFIGGLVYISTNNWLYSVTVGLTLGLFVLVATDWTQPAAEETFDTSGISISRGTSAPYAVAAIPIHWAVDKTLLGNIEASPDTIQDRLGVLGEPIFVGLVIGLVIGIVAYSNALFVAESWYAILTADISFAAVMHILPMMVGILMEGLTPLSESIRNYITPRFEDRDMTIGLDLAILIGHESVTASSLLVVPIAIVMSTILPGNDVPWGIDLATSPFFFAPMVPIMNGSIVKMIVTGTILLVPLHYISSAVAPLLTQAAGSADFDLGSRGFITSPVADAGSPATGILALIPAPVALVVGLVVVLGIWVTLRMWPQRMYMVAGASEEKARETIERRHTGKGGGLLPDKLGSTVDASGAKGRPDD